MDVSMLSYIITCYTMYRDDEADDSTGCSEEES